jgi:hypothetical protein
MGYLLWQRAGLPGIAVLCTENGIVGGVYGHVDIANRFFAKYRQEQLGGFDTLSDAKLAVEKRHATSSHEGAKNG